MRRRLGYLIKHLAVLVWALGCWVDGEESLFELEEAAGA